MDCILHRQPEVGAAGLVNLENEGMDSCVVAADGPPAEAAAGACRGGADPALHGSGHPFHAVTPGHRHPFELVFQGEVLA